MLWSKQFYHYVIKDWLQGDPAILPAPGARQGAQSRVDSPVQRGVISMPTSGISVVCGLDLRFTAFHSRSWIPTSRKSSSHSMLREWYMHPNGQIPA